MRSDLEELLINSMKCLDEDQVMSATWKLLEEEYSKYEIFNLLDAGSREVGKLFEKGDYFIADLIVSGNIYADVINYFNLSASRPTDHTIGSVLIGVVQGDIHEIGKDIISNHLRSESFQVTDLGVDVSPEDFSAAALKIRPDIIALSGVMASSAQAMGQTIHQLEQSGVRKFSSILIGGACVSKEICNLVHADGWSKTPMDTLNFCMSTVKEKTNES